MFDFRPNIDFRYQAQETGETFVHLPSFCFHNMHVAQDFDPKMTLIGQGHERRWKIVQCNM